MGTVTKKDLEAYVDVKREVKMLRAELCDNNFEAADSVQGSMESYPYIERTVVVFGIDERRRERLERRLKRKEEFCERVEEFVDSIDDSKLYPLINYYFLKGFNWPMAVRRAECDLSPDAARKKVQRFLENL